MGEWWDNLCVFHKWGKWDITEELWWTFIGNKEFIKIVQIKECERCGKTKRKELT